ncbi:HU family DNA-binding protein [Alistipes putredinis]|jgi:Bacterial nucleoid DNA-binding protein|uniref:HU family DNA-binding protein n=1 Tax=Alistipes putredinis TaxID=28117 RepID=UPI001899B46A|nr:MAG TPA: Bacterial DNA-binding protein [Caudoviricetes sp.]
MNKYILARQVSQELKKPMKEVLPIVNALFDQIVRSILDGQKVTISSLGSFRLRDCRERNGYDPYRREHILVPAGRSIRFTVSPALQERINMHYRQNRL